MKKVLVILTVILLLPCAAWATQEHSDPEGLYSHQIAHIFFMLAMAVLLVQIWRSRPLKYGWKYIGLSAFLFLLWNLDVFTVHWIRESITPDMFTGSDRDWTQRLDVSTLRAQVFYAGKIIDHFLTVGAMLAFIRGIRGFYPGKEGEAPQ